MTSYLKQYVTDNISKILSWSEYSSKVLELPSVVEWAIQTPRCTTFRVNTLLYNIEAAASSIRENLQKRLFFCRSEPPDVEVHETIPECIVIGTLNTELLDLLPTSDEIIVDNFCGASVLRGSHVFAPGVMGMLPYTNVGDTVSVYADLSKKCLKGYKQVYNEESKLFVGNGLACMDRHDLFDNNSQIKGLAVNMINPVSGLVMFEHTVSMGIIQNFPSMVCIRVLDPQPGDTVLDMCASPGNKTTHIATLMQNKGTIIAIDRGKRKINEIAQNCLEMGITCVTAFSADSQKLLGITETPLLEGPPFMPNTFDKILLDTTCSNTGQRPMLTITDVSESVIQSYSIVQRKFLQNAVELLKPNGILVYTTCSILCEENECMIAWVLKTYPFMELIPAEPMFGSPGLPECGLTEEQQKLVQRFGPGSVTKVDSIGFFIAKLKKKSICSDS